MQTKSDGDEESSEEEPNVTTALLLGATDDEPTVTPALLLGDTDFPDPLNVSPRVSVTRNETDATPSTSSNSTANPHPPSPPPPSSPPGDKS